MTPNAGGHRTVFILAIIGIAIAAVAAVAFLTLRTTEAPTSPGPLFELPQRLAQVEWQWDNAIGFDSVLIGLKMAGDPVPRTDKAEQGFHLGAMSGSVGGTRFYFGLQTHLGGSGSPNPTRGVIFSRWDTLDDANARVGEGGWKVLESG